MSIIDTFNGALRLNQPMLQTMRDAPDVLRRGLLVVLFVGLVVGGVNGARVVLALLNPSREVGSQQVLLEQQRQQMEPMFAGVAGAEVLQASLTLPLTLLSIGQRLTELPTPIPGPLAALVAGLSVMASSPLGYLGGVLLTVILTHIGAKQLGGQGTIQQMLGLGALSVAPHALDALRFVAVLGDALGLVAWGWGLIILITATSVAHRFDTGRATLAVLLYPVVFIILGVLAYCSLAIILVGLLTSMGA
jgi:hypothetical protein